MICPYCSDEIFTTHFCPDNNRVLNFRSSDNFYFYYNQKTDYDAPVKVEFNFKTNEIQISQTFHKKLFSLKDYYCWLGLAKLVIKGKANLIAPKALAKYLDKLPNIDIAQNKKKLQKILDQYIKLMAFE